MLRTFAVFLLFLLTLPLLANNVDLAASLSLSREPFLNGGFNVQLKITNNGPDAATGVGATLNIPVGHGYSYQIDRCKAVGPAQDVLDCTVGPLAAGASTTILAGVFTPPSPITVTANVISQDTELSSSNNSASFDIVPITVPELVPSLTVDPPLVGGRQSTLRLNIKNLGGGQARDVVALWTIDAEVAFPPVNCVITGTPNTWRCTFPSPIESQAEYPVFNAFLKAAPAGTLVTSRAEISSSTPDYHPENNVVTFSGTFASDADLAVSGTAGSTLDAEGRLLYRYTVTNRAASTATQVRVTLNMYDGGQFVSAQGANCGVPTSPGRVDCGLPDLAGNASYSFTFLAKEPTPAGHFSSSVTVNWSNPELRLTAFGVVSATVYHDIAVTNVNDSGSGSLRAALGEANTICINNTPCRIAFQIPAPVPASGWYTIAPLTPLPASTANELLVDGNAQTTLTGDTNPSGPEIEITGVNVAVPGDGLTLQDGLNTVRGLVLNGFSGNGLLVRHEEQRFSSLTLTDSYLGTDPTGEMAVPNHDRGVRLVAGGATIQNCVISGNGRSGIFVDRGAAQVLDNRIGVTPAGKPLGNGASGIYYGDLTPGGFSIKEVRGNVIAWNRDFGIAAQQPAGVLVRENSLHDNGGLAYDVGLDGPTPTTGSLSTAGLVERPQVLGARYDTVTGDTIIDLKLDATPPYFNTTYTLYIFATPHLNRAGYAEGETFLTKVVLPRDNRTSQVRVHADLRGQYITALTERFVDFGDGQVYASSEMGEGVRVP